MMPKIYLAGPMSGYPQLNHPAFFEYAEALSDGGWTVFNPAQSDIDQFGTTENTIAAMHHEHDTFMRTVLSADLQWICEEANAIAMMPGWELSLGARAEHSTAVALGLQIIYL